VTPEIKPAISDSAEGRLKAEVLIENYKIIAEWIRFADAKAAATLTVNGVLLGLLIPTLKTYLSDRTTVHPTPWWEGLVVILFVIWLLLLVASAVQAFLCILPFRGHGRQIALEHVTHFHAVGIAQNYKIDELERFLSECELNETADLKRQIRTAILIDSHLSNAKYGFVARSIWCLAGSAVFGFLYLLAIQF
jgi:hypothetical protein